MADVNANIGVNIDTSAALAQLKDLQRQISQFHSSIAKSSEVAGLAQRDLQRNFLNSVNSLGAFSAELRTVKTTSESFTNSLEKNKFSMREYFRYAGASTQTFGKLFKSEYDTIGKVAEDRVKKLQTQYIKMGRDATGAMKAIAIIPNELDMGSLATQTQIAAQKQAVFNQLMKQGSTNLLNFGKNTQWAGRQLMVGFTLPLMAVGSAASKSFMQMEAQALKFKKVYGDLFTPQEETQQALSDIQELARQFTKYGIAVADTVGLAAEAAAAGFKGVDLQRQTTEATRLSVLGQIDNQQALSTTIALQNAFGISSAELADNINFLNAVENQTVVSLDDITTAIPKVAPVIQQLGGDVKDLAFFLTAMKEGGINASEGANALKSGLASLINPTTRAREMLQGLGIDIVGIVNKNKGDLKSTVIGFAQALDTLAPLQRAQAIEQMFGKFQFARLSALFRNVTRDGTQAARVLDLAGASVEDLANLSNQELGKTAESSMNKFKKAVEDLKAAIVPVGEAFLKTVTPIIEFISKIAEKFSNLSDGTKKAITVMITVIGGLGPILLMTFGLLANGVANIIKLFLTLRTGYQTLTGQSKNLGEQTQYFTSEQLEAAAAAHSLNQAHATLTQQFTVEAEALQRLIAVYTEATSAAARFAATNPGMMVPPRVRKKFANGGIIRGPGGPKDDKIQIMASNGEAIIDAKTVNANREEIDSLLSTGKFVPKTYLGGPSASVLDTNPSQVNRLSQGLPGIPQKSAEEIADRVARQLAQIEASKARRAAATQSMTVAPVPQQQVTPQLNTSGMISGTLGMSVSAAKDKTNLFKAPGVIKPQTTAKTWSTMNAEIDAMTRAAEEYLRDLGFGAQDIQKKVNQLVQKQASHITEQIKEIDVAGKSIDVKLWNSDNLIADFGGINNYLNSLHKVTSSLTKSDIQELAAELNMTIPQFEAELQKLNDNIHPTTRQAGQVLGAVAKRGSNSTDKTLAYQSRAVAAGMDVRLGGDFYETAPTRAYDTTKDAKSLQQTEANIAKLKTELLNSFNISDDIAVLSGKNTQALQGAWNKLSLEAKERVAALSNDVGAFTSALMNEAKEAGIAGFKVGDEAIKGIAKGTQSASDSKKAIQEGKNVTNGFIHAIQNGQDDALAAGKKLGDSGINGVQQSTQKMRRVSTRGQGAPLSQVSTQILSLPKTEEQLKSFNGVLSQSGPRLAKMNNALQGGSFALMSLSGMAQMFGGTLGKVSSVIFNVSGALFALQTVTQLLTQAKALELVQTRLGMAKSAMRMAAGGGGVAGMGGLLGKSGLMGNIARLGFGISKFLGPIGIATTVVGGLVVGFKLLRDAQERERNAIEGLGNAAELTDKKLKALGGFFNVVATKSAFERGKTAVSGEVQVGSKTRTQLESLKQDKGFQEAFAGDIKALKGATNKQAKLVFDSLAIDLKGKGYAAEQIQTIITAIQEEAGKTDIKFDVKSIDVSTKEGQDRMAKNVETLTKSLSNNLSKGMSTVYRQIYDPKTQKLMVQPFVELSKGAKKNLNIVSKSITSMFSGLSGQLEAGVISAEQFDGAFERISKTISSMPKAQSLVLMENLLNSLPKKLKESALGIGDVSSQLLLLKAQAAGVAVTAEIISAMTTAEKASGPNAGGRKSKAKDVIKEFEKKIAAAAAAFKKINDAFNSGTEDGAASSGPSADTLSKEAKLTIARLQKELDALKTKRDVINQTNNELKRQYDYQQKLMQLSQDAVQAKISGNYIGAAILGQQKSFETGQFNKETDALALDKKITDLENRVSGLQAGERVSAAERALLKAKSKGKAMGGLIKGPGTGKSDSILAGFALGGLPQLTVSNGEYVVQAKAVQNYGVGFMDALNNQKLGLSGGNTQSSSTSTVYNIDMVINGGDAGTIADQVIRRLKIETSKNNKSNMVKM